MVWHIDALDAGAGRAFTSFRPNNLLEAETLDESEVTFFIEPPTFDPVQVSRAIAFAAMRYQFQEGLFDGDGEVPFNDLADVVEFVRRSYMRRGGRGGGGEGGGGEAPAPPLEGPLGPGEAEKEGGIDPVPGLREIAEQFRDQSEKVGRGHSKPVDFVQSKPAGSGRNARARLASGALRIALEQIRIYSKAGGEEATAQRRSNMLRLFNLIIGADLELEFRSAADAYPGLPGWLDDQFNRIGVDSQYGPFTGKVPWTTWLILPFLATAGEPTGHWSEALKRYHHRDGPYPSYYYGVAPFQIDDDPIDLLGRLSAPEGIASQYARRKDEPVFLDQFLFSLLAAPQLCIAQGNMLADVVLELALFASACIVLPSTLRKYPNPSLWDNRPWSIENLLAGEAEKWLRENLPGKVFPLAVEKMIVERDQFAGVAMVAAV